MGASVGLGSRLGGGGGVGYLCGGKKRSEVKKKKKGGRAAYVCGEEKKVMEETLNHGLTFHSILKSIACTTIFFSFSSIFYFSFFNFLTIFYLVIEIES
jgi:hypothetical protein